MDSSAHPLDFLHAFRDSLYRCFDRRADALFELTDAILTAGFVPSPVHLSLAAVHRRGWGSFYAALSNGRIDEGRLHSLLSGHPLGDGSLGDLPIYAVDVWVWSRSDAEASPGRGYYYPLRHSAGQPIVAGWAYQILAELGFERDSWVAPVDARRVRPAEDTDEAAAEQMRALMGQLPEPETVPSSSSMPSLRSGQTPACSGRRTGAMQTWVKVAYAKTAESIVPAVSRWLFI